MERKSKFIYAIIALVSILSFSNCDSYQSRKNLVTELSLLYSENQNEFKLLEEYFANDTIAKFFTFENRDYKIEVSIDENITIFDSVDQVKDNPTVYQILAFMEKNKIQTIYGYGNGMIEISLKGNRALCFNFIYRSDFNPDDANVKEQIENIKDTKTKRWIYILDKKGWYVRGVKCF